MKDKNKQTKKKKIQGQIDWALCDRQHTLTRRRSQNERTWTWRGADESCFWGVQLNIYVFENVLAFHHIWFIKTPYSLASGHASF